MCGNFKNPRQRGISGRSLVSRRRKNLHAASARTAAELDAKILEIYADSFQMQHPVADRSWAMEEARSRLAREKDRKR